VIETDDGVFDMRAPLSAAEVGEMKKELAEELKQREEKTQEQIADTQKYFEKTLRNHWLTQGAINMELAIDLMKRRVSEKILEKTEEYRTGKSDEGLGLITMSWETTSIIERIFLQVPKQIKKLEITIGEERITLAGEEELVQPVEEEQEGKEQAAEGPEKTPASETENGADSDNNPPARVAA
jgi:hypothetical protein